MYRHFRADPWFNMAFDEQMFTYVKSHPGTVLLRLYTWQTPTITIGLHQKEERAIDSSHLGSTPLIRRVTGGRAVFHDASELTYAVAANIEPHLGRGRDHPLRGSISAVHRVIAGALQAFLAECEVEAQVIRRSAPANSNPAFFHTSPCFASVARDELVSGERKVLASAQRRIGPAFLQHGSIKLFGLVSHPALPPADGLSSKTLDPIDKDRYSELTVRFESTLMRQLDLRAAATSESPDLAELAVTSAASLRKKPLVRRIIL